MAFDWQYSEARATYSFFVLFCFSFSKVLVEPLQDTRNRERDYEGFVQLPSAALPTRFNFNWLNCIIIAL